MPAGVSRRGARSSTTTGSGFDGAHPSTEVISACREHSGAKEVRRDKRGIETLPSQTEVTGEAAFVPLGCYVISRQRALLDSG
jgi:hypothetical protein